MEVAYEVPLYQRHVAQMPEVPEVPLYKVPPSVTAMSDADIDAAVRFCDDVLSAPSLILLPPTVDLPNLDPGWRAFFWKHRTVTFPVARIETASSPALFVKIEIPKIFKWDASIVTASGACVARWSQKAKWNKPISRSCALFEWGCKRFGVVGMEENQHRCGVSAPGQAIYAKGPTQDVVFAEDFNSKRNDLKLLGMKIMIFSCFTLNLCALFPLCAADGEPYEALFKTFRGTEIGGFKIEKHRQCCVSGDDSLPKTEAVVHFGNMTAEQLSLIHI